MSTENDAPKLDRDHLEWPEVGKQQPTVAEVLAPLIDLLSANLRVAKKDAPPAARAYKGYPFQLDTLPDPERLIEEEHTKLRATRRLPFSDPMTLILLAAFLLGVEHTKRSLRSRAPSGGPGGGGRPQRSTRPRTRRPGDERFY